MDNFINTIKAGGGRKAAGSILKQSGTEAAEETATGVANII